jgi:DNA end-binding protein Ku
VRQGIDRARDHRDRFATQTFKKGTTMPRAIWTGAISFGLVHVPVSLYPGSSETGIDFDWLDKRSMDPVGYKRINKRTGKEVERENIVKGVKAETGDYVILSEDEIKAAYPKTTQTIEIEGFVHAAEIPFVYLEKPYYLEPLNKGEKVYALLREAMAAAGVIGIARVVMHTKEHLAALIPSGPGLVLNTLRWSDEIRDMSALDLPAAGKRAANIKDAELRMAEQLIGDMTVAWEPGNYTDHFSDAVHALVKQRVDAGKTEKVEPLEEGGEATTSSNVIDLTALLKQSLSGRKAGTSSHRPKSAANEEEIEAKPARKVAKKVARKRAA